MAVPTAPVCSGGFSGASHFEILQEGFRGASYFGDCPVEDLLIVIGGLAEPTYLPHVLEGGGFDFFGRCWGCSVPELFD